MSRSKLIHNILKSIYSLSDDQPLINILYENTDSIFDLSFRMCSNLCITCPSYPNSAHLAHDIYWSNEPTQYISRIGDIQSQHIHDIIYFRNMSEHNIKKEDKFLIQNRFVSSCQIARNYHVQSDWHINKNSLILEYGIPDTNISNANNRDRDSSVIILNTHNNKSIENLYNNIKQHLPDSYMLTNISHMSYTQLCSMMQKYRVCIETQDTYNILFGIANGCHVISTINHDNEDISHISNYDDIISVIKSELVNYNDNKKISMATKILEKYPFDRFEQSVLYIIHNILSNAVIL